MLNNEPMNKTQSIIDKLTKANIEVSTREREITFGEDAGKKLLIITAKIPRERELIDVTFLRSIPEEIILDSKIEHFKFIKDYEAIWSPVEKVIECEIIPLVRVFSMMDTLKRKLERLFSETEVNGEGEDEMKKDEFKRYEFEDSKSGIKLSIGPASVEHAILFSSRDRMRRFDFSRRRSTIRIENIDITKHEEALKALEKIGESLLFKLDVSIDLGYELARDREIRRAFYRKAKIDYSSDLSFPVYEYDKESMSLYWYAKSAFDLPLLQFLAYYQILEFYFPIFSLNDAHQKIKNILKDPRFNPNKDADVTKILSAIQINKTQKGFGTEIEQLKATLKSCIDNGELKLFIEDVDDRKDFFTTKISSGLSKKKISISSIDADLVSEISERIYEIRCRIVHTKASEGNYELLLPSSPELKYLGYDIAVLELIATKLLISTSRDMRI